MSNENRNNTFLGLIAVLLFSSVGVVLSGFIVDIFMDLQMNSMGLIKDIVDFLSEPGLRDGILWIIISFIVYFGIGLAFPDGAKVGPFSSLLYMLWISVNLGLVIGLILWILIGGGGITTNLDLIVTALYNKLVFSLGPTFAAALGIVNKLETR